LKIKSSIWLVELTPSTIGRRSFLLKCKSMIWLGELTPPNECEKEFPIKSKIFDLVGGTYSSHFSFLL
ncbi:MAG: hypothetical protein RR128_03850, partial [Clostridium sp.]